MPGTMSYTCDKCQDTKVELSAGVKITDNDGWLEWNLKGKGKPGAKKPLFVGYTCPVCSEVLASKTIDPSMVLTALWGLS